MHHITGINKGSKKNEDLHISTSVHMNIKTNLSQPEALSLIKLQHIGGKWDYHVRAISMGF